MKQPGRVLSSLARNYSRSGDIGIKPITYLPTYLQVPVASNDSALSKKTARCYYLFGHSLDIERTWYISKLGRTYALDRPLELVHFGPAYFIRPGYLFTLPSDALPRDLSNIYAVV